jgi:Uma2 family endonuclease
MSTAEATVQYMTAEELLALPDDGVERDLIEGQLRERPMTRRNRRHSRTMVKTARILDAWADQKSGGRGEILAGDAGFRLRQDPDTTVGIDVAYVSAQLAASAPDDVYLIDGAPVLAAEILSPSDTHEDIVEKIELLLKSGTAVVWLIDPDLRTVTVHRPGSEPVLFSASQELCGDPELPNFRVKVSELFAH